MELIKQYEKVEAEDGMIFLRLYGISGSQYILGSAEDDTDVYTEIEQPMRSLSSLRFCDVEPIQVEILSEELNEGTRRTKFVFENKSNGQRVDVVVKTSTENPYMSLEAILRKE